MYYASNRFDEINFCEQMFSVFAFLIWFCRYWYCAPQMPYIGTCEVHWNVTTPFNNV